MGKNTCISHFLLQMLDVEGIHLPQADGLIKIAHVPIYQTFMTLYDRIGHEHQCGLYGWDETKFRICGRTYMENQRDSVLLGKAFAIFERLAYSGKEASFCSPSSLHLPDEEGREDRDNCHFYPALSINVWKRYADLTYLSPERSIEAIENLSDPIPVNPVSLETYFKLYDILFPAFSTDVDPDGVDTYLFKVAGLAGKKKLRSRQLELYLLPWLMQQPDMSAIDKAVPGENLFSAIYCQSVYRIQFDFESFWIFIILCAVSQIWCLWGVIQIYSKPKPSSLSAVRFPENIGAQNGGMDAMIISGLTGMTMKDLDVLAKVEVCLEVSEDIELDTMV